MPFVQITLLMSSDSLAKRSYMELEGVRGQMPFVQITLVMSSDSLAKRSVAITPSDYFNSLLCHEIPCIHLPIVHSR